MIQHMIFKLTVNNIKYTHREQNEYILIEVIFHLPPRVILRVTFFFPSWIGEDLVTN